MEIKITHRITKTTSARKKLHPNFFNSISSLVISLGAGLSRDEKQGESVLFQCSEFCVTYKG
jgi:hypothetical protein